MFIATYKELVLSTCPSTERLVNSEARSLERQLPTILLHMNFPKKQGSDLACMHRAAFLPATMKRHDTTIRCHEEISRCFVCVRCSFVCSALGRSLFAWVPDCFVGARSLERCAYSDRSGISVTE